MAVEVGIVNKSGYPLPGYAKPGDSGMDVRAVISEAVTLGPLERMVFPTGIFLDIPVGYEIQIRPRSGLTSKRGLTVLNAPGTIDSGYTAELGVILVNLSPEPQVVEPGERIAQIVLAPVSEMQLHEVQEIAKKTERGGSGYGNSGRF